MITLLERSGCRKPMLSLRIGPPEGSASNAEPDVHDVAVADSIISPLGPQEAHLPPLGHPARLGEVVVRDHLGANEPPLEVAVNGPGCLGRQGPVPDRPGPD